MNIDPRQLREVNRELVAFYDSPEYRQLFAGYRAPSVEITYRAREGSAQFYRRWNAGTAPENEEWDILKTDPRPDDEILSQVAQKTVNAQAALADEYQARLQGERAWTSPNQSE
jgi:hypothetical protein